MKNILAILLFCITLILTSCQKEVSTTPVSGVEINKSALTLTEGAKERLTATVLPDKATDKRVMWSSSNTSVATVSANGEVTAVSLGSTTITVVSAADNTKTATSLVTVAKPEVAVTLVGINNKPLSLLVGDRERLLVTVLPDDATDKSVTYTSDNPSVATVSPSAEVVAVGTGVATITVASVFDKTKTDACVVTVTAPIVTTAAIGNFYYSDGFQTQIYDNTKSCLGVVFWVDPLNNKKGMIVSLDEQELEWSTKIETTRVTNNTNGRANMYLLNEFVRASANSVWGDYPAFNWVATLKNGRHVGGWSDTDMWYLPAHGELVSLFGSNGATKTIVNESLSSISDAVALSSHLYCSSTENDDMSVTFVSLSSGLSQSLVKFSANKVRAIAAF